MVELKNKIPTGFMPARNQTDVMISKEVIIYTDKGQIMKREHPIDLKNIWIKAGHTEDHFYKRLFTLIEEKKVYIKY